MNLSPLLLIATLLATPQVASAQSASGLTAPPRGQATAAAAQWDYEDGDTGPVHRGELDPAFEACSQGSYQSPIDIRDPVIAVLPALHFEYPSIQPSIVNVGHTIKISTPKDATLRIGAQIYTLQQIHFHAPSEEAFNGLRADMVAHFVHKNALGQLAVVAVLLQAGPDNTAYAPIFSNLPHPDETVSLTDIELPLNALLPEELSYYRFAGSLTTPPCSEGVEWIVMHQPVNIGSAQIEAFHQRFKSNARPVQALNGREVQYSK